MNTTETEPERPPSTDSALLTEYRWHDDCVSGLIFSEQDSGRRLTTSPVCEKWSAAGTLHVRTVSGAVFRLGDEAQAQYRNARQFVSGPSVLDQLDLASNTDSLLAARNLRCVVGGSEAGGHATSSLLRSSLCVDDGVLQLQGSRISARRVVLLRQGTPVAAAVVEAHCKQKALEVVMLATDRAWRLRGYGSLLMALLSGMARQLSLPLLLATPDEASRAYWLRCGWHTAAFCAPSIRSALRRLDQSGAIRGWTEERASAAVMAYAVTSSGDSSTDSSTDGGTTDNGYALCSDRASQDEIGYALRRLEPLVAAGFKGAAAARARGYVELSTCVRGCGGDGAVHTALSPVEYGPRDELPTAFPRVPYAKLEAFDTGSEERGWGVRSASRIPQGSIVVEVVGHCLSAEQIENVDDLEYVVGFDDRTMEAKARLGDPMQYIDCRTHGNLMRLMNDCEEAPNLQLFYWPPPDEAAGIMPRRIFLMSTHDIPAGVELTFNYGQNYDRHWKHGAARPGRSPRAMPPPPVWGDAGQAAAAGTTHGTIAADSGRTPRRRMPTEARPTEDASADATGASIQSPEPAAEARAVEQGASAGGNVVHRRRRPAMRAVASMQTSVYAVEKLVAVRQTREVAASSSGAPQREFQVRWRGYRRAADSWVAEADILDPCLVSDFYQREAEAAAHAQSRDLPAAEPPYGAQVVGRRVSMRWLAEPGKPWFEGRVAEYRPWAVPPTHLVSYDDGDLREHVLENELAVGTLRWLNAKPNARTAGDTSPAGSSEALVPTPEALVAAPLSAPLRSASGSPHKPPPLRRTESSAQDWWLPAPLRKLVAHWRTQQQPDTLAVGTHTSMGVRADNAPVRMGRCDTCHQSGVELVSHLGGFCCSSCADAESGARHELEAQQRRREQQWGGWQPPPWSKLPAAGFTPFLEVGDACHGAQ